MFGMLWIDVYDSVFQFPPVSNNFAQPLKRSGTNSTGHNQQPDQLYVKEISYCMRQMVVTPDTVFLIHAPTKKVSVTNRCISVFPVM